MSAIDAWPIPEMDRRPDKQPRVIVVDLRGLPEPCETLDELRFLTFADANVNPSGVMNRTDSFGFAVPGRYLVICNVRGHLLDGRYAWINVIDDDRGGDRDDD